MTTLTTRGPAAAKAIRDRVPFRTHGALSAEAGVPGINRAGRLTGADLDKFYGERVAIDYAVWSYATPIAWHTPTGWHRVIQKFSRTTSQHQGKLYLIGD